MFWKCRTNQLFFRMVSPGLVSILVLSVLPVTIQVLSSPPWHFPRRCPKIIERCRYRERDECEKDKECRWGKKCCEFSCGKKCLESRLDICTMPKDPGPCMALFHRWWYDYRTKTCLTFYYGGCEGNSNNFQTKDMCQSACPTIRPRKNREQPPGFGLDPRLFV